MFTRLNQIMTALKVLFHCKVFPFFFLHSFQTLSKLTMKSLTVASNKIIKELCFNQFSRIYHRSCLHFDMFTGQQLTIFNSQSKVLVGGKKDGSGRIIRPFKGTIAGRFKVFC